MATTPADVIIGSVRQRVAFIHSQVALGMPRDQIIASQVNALISFIGQQSNLDIATVTTVGTELVVGPWSDDQRIAIATALSNAMGGAVPSHGGRKQQECNWLERYLTQSDWTAIKSTDLSSDAKLRVVGSRMWRIGITCPKEACLERGAAIVYAVGGTGVLPASMLKAMCDKLKEFVKDFDRATPQTFPHIQKYPMDPMYLGAPRRNFAYGDDVPVDDVEATHEVITQAASGIFYRGTAKALKGAQPSTTALVAAKASAPPGGLLAANGPQDIQSMIAQVGNQIVQGLFGGSMGQGPVPGLQIFADKLYRQPSNRSVRTPQSEPGAPNTVFGGEVSTTFGGSPSDNELGRHVDAPLVQASACKPAEPAHVPAPGAGAAGAAAEVDAAAEIEGRMREAAVAAGHALGKIPMKRKKAAAACSEGELDKAEPKPKPKGKAKAKGHAKAKASAKGTTKGAKRCGSDPAGKVDIKDLLKPSQIGDRDKNTYASWVYGRARARAAALGLSGDSVSEVGRSAYRSAAAVWDKGAK
ncbi:unnamed protein product [Prorocentrum cordatum]|uniref:Uncharacterized protein n=1 Tax=Prorocentrum cordatum TaxID=2364126 RepID=A0ABN9R937_9DINO|nr:unnamed protein product [Polarella glacialis]